MFGFSKNEVPVGSKKSWLGRLRDGLKRTRGRIADGIGNIILGKKTIDTALLDQLETVLLTADIGIETTQEILKQITEQVSRKSLTNTEALVTALKAQFLKILLPCQQPLLIDKKPFVLLMVGVNGVGKTTTIAKMAHYYQQQGKKIMLAAGDTFRAAAIDQLKVWGERNNVPVIAQKPGSDSASVIYDAMESATAKAIDLLIADTAGRLHTQDPLMAELQKIKRVIQKQNSQAPHECMLIVDAGTGQNALNQAKQFHQSIGLTSVTLTKLDGTAKGGMIFSIANQMKLPIRFIGVGEKMEDLKPFDAKEFVDALFE